MAKRAVSGWFNVADSTLTARLSANSSKPRLPSATPWHWLPSRPPAASCFEDLTNTSDPGQTITVNYVPNGGSGAGTITVNPFSLFLPTSSPNSADCGGSSANHLRLSTASTATISGNIAPHQSTYCWQAYLSLASTSEFLGYVSRARPRLVPHRKCVYSGWHLLRHHPDLQLGWRRDNPRHLHFEYVPNTINDHSGLPPGRYGWCAVLGDRHCIGRPSPIHLDCYQSSRLSPLLSSPVRLRGLWGSGLADAGFRVHGRYPQRHASGPRPVRVRFPGNRQQPDYRRAKYTPLAIAGNSGCSLFLSSSSANLPASGTSTIEICSNNSGEPNCGVTPEIPISVTVTPGAGCGPWTAYSSDPEVLR